MELLDRIRGLWSSGGLALTEILLLSLVLFVFFRFLRGTRGAPVLRGVLILIGISIGIVFLTASLLQLEHITWIFEKLAALFFLAFLILFHDVRRQRHVAFDGQQRAGLALAHDRHGLDDLLQRRIPNPW